MLFAGFRVEGLGFSDFSHTHTLWFSGFRVEGLGISDFSHTHTLCGFQGLGWRV
jgi:hypothetical protein